MRINSLSTFFVCFLNKKCFSTTPGCCTKSTSHLLSINSNVNRADVVLKIAKKFENISLENFPLNKCENFNLSKYNEVAKANLLCNMEHLDSNPNFYPSITTILNQTMPPESLAALKKWESQKIKQLGLESFERYKKELFTRGRTLHKNIQTFFLTKDTSKLNFKSKVQENMWKSIEHILPQINLIYATESSVQHPILKFRGILDCFASYQNVPTVFEWKTSEKLRPTLAQTYDNPLQAVAYFSCLQFDESFLNKSKNISIPEEVLLVIAYENGERANLHLIEHTQRDVIWRKFLSRLEKYWSKITNDSQTN